jgi:hypothetical protein
MIKRFWESADQLIFFAVGLVFVFFAMRLTEIYQHFWPSLATWPWPDINEALVAIIFLGGFTFMFASFFIVFVRTIAYVINPEWRISKRLSSDNEKETPKYGLFGGLRCYERASLIITSNKSYLDWGEIFNDHVLATAILDRLLHHSTTLNIKGESYRLKEKRRAGLLGRPRPVTEDEKEVALAN